MQLLIALIAAIVLAYAFKHFNKNAYSISALIRIFIKRLALYLMTLSWVIFLAVGCIIAFYSNISEFLKDSMSADAISCIKSLVRFVFGVDSAFVALQIVTIYSMLASFVSCLILSAGAVVRTVYRTAFKAERTYIDDGGLCLENTELQTQPAFKLYLKYNS